jgi:hypothetical protein
VAKFSVQGEEGEKTEKLLLDKKMKLCYNGKRVSGSAA